METLTADTTTRRRGLPQRLSDYVDWCGIERVQGHYYLYGICAPGNPDRYYYIGITRNPEQRYSAHQTDRYGSRRYERFRPGEETPPEPFADWWAKIRVTGDRPRLQILADVGTDIEIARKCERATMRLLLSEGNSLFNLFTYIPPTECPACNRPLPADDIDLAIQRIKATA